MTSCIYWAQMHAEEGAQPSSDDGFRKPYENTTIRGSNKNS